MRRLPGPASCPLCDGVKTPEAPVELFRGWQRTQTQSSVRTLRSLRQQMDVWFCLMQESSAERHCCVTADPDQTNSQRPPVRAREFCAFLLTLTYIDVAKQEVTSKSGNVRVGGYSPTIRTVACLAVNESGFSISIPCSAVTISKRPDSSDRMRQPLPRSMACLP